MKPYFDTNHIAGPLLLIVTMAWGAMEVSRFPRGWKPEKEPPRSAEQPRGRSSGPA